MTVTLVRDGVNVYDLNSKKFVRRYDSHATAERHLEIARELGDTLTEYDTTDRDGNPLRIVFQVEHDLPESNDCYSVNAASEGIDAGGVWEFTSPRPADGPDVAVYDIEFDVAWTADGADREPWDRVTCDEADDALAAFAEMGDTVQTYETTDRDGNPLRIALLVQDALEEGRPDMGAVYEFAS